MKKQSSPLKRFLLILLFVVLLLIIAVAGLFLFLTITEYRPASVEPVAVEGHANKSLAPGDSFRIFTWNTGYIDLGDNADFFMDGGTHVKTATQERAEQNLAGIIEEVTSLSPDVVFLGEVDINSDRSYHINNLERYKAALPDYCSAFATNYKVPFVPYPIPPIGKVHSGIATFSVYPISSAERIQLPCPFSWPVRLGNLKRCLLISRVPLEGTDKELVLISLHLEAYDDGAGKVAQTAMLREYLDQEFEKGNYVIAGGDFNQLFSNVDASAYPVYEGKWQPGIIDINDFSDAFTFVMDNSVPSCRSLDRPYAGEDPSNFQFYLIDGFIVSDNIQIDSVQTRDLQFVCSDHNPVLMQVTLLP